MNHADRPCSTAVAGVMPADHCPSQGRTRQDKSCSPIHVSRTRKGENAMKHQRPCSYTRIPMKIRHPIALIVLVCATLLSSHPGLAQFSQQGPKLVGTGAAGSARQGQSVSLSADGNTAIVGGFADNSFAGAAWVWTRSGAVWTQQGSKLVGSGAVGSAE